METSMMSWKKPSAPGRKPKFEKQRIGLFPKIYCKMKKHATKNGLLFNILPPDVIKIIQKMHDGLVQW